MTQQPRILSWLIPLAAFLSLAYCTLSLASTSPRMLSFVPLGLLDFLFRPILLSPGWLALVGALGLSLLSLIFAMEQLRKQAPTAKPKRSLAAIGILTALTLSGVTLWNFGLPNLATSNSVNPEPISLQESNFGSTNEAIEKLTSQSVRQEGLEGSWNGLLSEAVSTSDPDLIAPLRDTAKFEFKLASSGEGYSMTVDGRTVSLKLDAGTLNSEDGTVVLSSLSGNRLAGTLRRGDWNFKFQARR